MLKKIGYLFLLSCVFACSKKPVEVPADVIPRDSMIVLLAEIHLVEASIQVLNVDVNDSTQSAAYGLYRYVFTKHHITQEKFKRSFDFYRSEPAYFHQMYDEVITKLSEDQAKYSTPPPARPKIQKMRPDSIVNTMPLKK